MNLKERIHNFLNRPVTKKDKKYIFWIVFILWLTVLGILQNGK